MKKYREAKLFSFFFFLIHSNDHTNFYSNHFDHKRRSVNIFGKARAFNLHFLDLKKKYVGKNESERPKKVHLTVFLTSKDQHFAIFTHTKLQVIKFSRKHLGVLAELLETLQPSHAPLSSQSLWILNKLNYMILREIQRPSFICSFFISSTTYHYWWPSCGQ